MIRPVKRSACFITPLIMTTGVFIMLLLSANLSIKRCRPANTDVLPLQRLQVPDTSRYAADKNPGKADNPSSPERTSCGNTRIIKLRPARARRAGNDSHILCPSGYGHRSTPFRHSRKPKQFVCPASVPTVRPSF